MANPFWFRPAASGSRLPALWLPGSRLPDPGSRLQLQAQGSLPQLPASAPGFRSRLPAPGFSFRPGAGSMEPGAGGRSAGSLEPGAGSRESGAGSPEARKPGSRERWESGAGRVGAELKRIQHTFKADSGMFQNGFRKVSKRIRYIFKTDACRFQSKRIRSDSKRIPTIPASPRVYDVSVLKASRIRFESIANPF